ncbi:MAG: hypothetical protein ABJO09_01085 [Hyphomicrobiales bacterium]
MTLNYLSNRPFDVTLRKVKIPVDALSDEIEAIVAALSPKMKGATDAEICAAVQAANPYLANDMEVLAAIEVYHGEPDNHG